MKLCILMTRERKRASGVLPCNVCKGKTATVAGLHAIFSSFNLAPEDKSIRPLYIKTFHWRRKSDGPDKFLAQLIYVSRAGAALLGEDCCSVKTHQELAPFNAH